MIRFEIKPEVVEWLVQDWVREPEMAQELIEGLMGMMIAYGCISAGDDGRLKQAAPSLLAACEAALYYIGAGPINKIDYRDADEILDQLAAAIDEAKGSDTPPRGHEA